MCLMLIHLLFWRIATILLCLLHLTTRGSTTLVVIRCLRINTCLAAPTITHWHVISERKWKGNAPPYEDLGSFYKLLFFPISISVPVVPEKVQLVFPVWFNARLFMLKNKKSRLLTTVWFISFLLFYSRIRRIFCSLKSKYYSCYMPNKKSQLFSDPKKF